MDFNSESLKLHEEKKGKVAVSSLVDITSRDDLSIAYTPGVAEPCRKISSNPEDVYKYTFKGRMVAVISNGSAVLGLGNIGPEAGLPVMEGKSILFKELAGVEAFPLVIKANTTDEMVKVISAVAPTFGGINLEDIKSPECFEVEDRLKEILDIPVFHDDQHGTAIVVTAALTNALKVVKKNISDVKIVVNGPGAAGTAIIKMLITAGAKDIVAVDSKGIISKNSDRKECNKVWISNNTNPRNVEGNLSDAVNGADVFIGVSKPNCLTEDMAKTMNSDAIVFAMANPTPEIMPDVASKAGVRIIATGRSDFPNQINNVLCFPGMFKGALEAKARTINDEMKLSAVRAIAELIPDDELSDTNIIPSALDGRVSCAVAEAVKRAAVESGVTR